MSAALLRGAIHPLALLLYFFAAWESVSRAGLIPASILPSASQVLIVLVDLLIKPSVWAAIGLTLVETGLAFLIAMPAGIALGILLADRYWGAVFKPVFYFLFSLPKAIFLPMFILTIGIGVMQKIAYGVFSMIFIVVISIATAAQSVRGSYLLVATCYGATSGQVVRHVFLPSMLPAILETMRLGMIFNFSGIILAEMYVSRLGIGNLIGAWGENYQLPQLLAGILIVSALAILFNESVRAVEKRYGHWRTG